MSKYLVRPPPSVLSGDSVPRENETDEYPRIYQRMKDIRCKILDRNNG
jgi:hypothetical protein